MKTHSHNATVPAGVYLSWRPFDIRVIDLDAHPLDGREGALYRRLPALLVVAATPLLGSAFVLLLPVMVLAAVAVALARGGFNVARRATSRSEQPRRFAAGQPAPTGFYVSFRPLSACRVGADQEPIEGRDGARYRRIPTILVVAVSPLLGGLFVVAFPVIVAGAVLAAIGLRVTHLAQTFANENAHLVELRWEPAAAYLTPPEAEEPEADASTEPTASPELDRLQDEVQERLRAERTAE